MNSTPVSGQCDDNKEMLGSSQTILNSTGTSCRI